MEQQTATLAKVGTRTDPRVLIVDDDPDILTLLKTAMYNEGFDVVVAPGGAEAMHIIDNDRPDVVVLDLMMPVVDGFTVLRRLRYRVKRPRVVCLTAKTAPMDRETAWRLGVDEFITKPFDLSGLVDSLSSVLGRTPVQRVARRLRALSEFDGEE